MKNYHFSKHAFTKLMNKGCGFSTVEEYSGWNWVPMYHFFSGISTISTKSAAGLIPTHCMPFFSYSFL